MLSLLRSTLFPLQWKPDIHRVFPKQVWLELTQGGDNSTRSTPHSCNGPRTVAYDNGLLVTVQLCLHEGQPDDLPGYN